MAIAKKKKRFFDVEIPIINKETQLQAFELKDLDGRFLKYDLTRSLRGKSALLQLKVIVKDDKATTVPRKLKLMPYYLKRMVRAFKGHVPLALAAYNVGIGNMRKWLKNREITKNLQNKLTSHPRTDLWMDEMPWSETRYYVKAVLRNYLIYRMIEKKKYS